MDIIKSKRGPSVMPPRAPLPPMTIPPLIKVKIKEPSEIEYHTDDEASEASKPATPQEQNGARPHENGVRIQYNTNDESDVVAASAVPVTEQMQNDIDVDKNGASQTKPKTDPVVSGRDGTERKDGVKVGLDTALGHGLKLKETPKVSFSKKSTIKAVPAKTMSKATPVHACKSHDLAPVEPFHGTPRVLLPLGDVRRTQRRVAALLNQKPVGIVQPKQKSPRKAARQKGFHFCVCSRIDPDGLFRDPALNFLREGLKNVGKDFPDFQYSHRRVWPHGHGPTTAQSMDDALLPRSPLFSPIRDPYTGRPNTKGVLSPGDITDFDYKKLKNLIMSRNRLPNIMDSQKVTKPNNAFASREVKSSNSRVPGNTPVGTADSSLHVKLPTVTSPYETSTNEPGEDQPTRSVKRVDVLGNDIASAKVNKTNAISEMMNRNHRSQVSGLRAEASFKPKPFDGAIQTKAGGGGGGAMNEPFGGAIQTKPFEGAMHTRSVAKTKTQISDTQENNVQQTSSGYETEGAVDNVVPPPPPQRTTAPRLLRHEDSALLRSMPTMSHELSVVGQGSREPTLCNDYTFIRTQATRSTTQYTDESYSFVRGREDTDDDSFLMPSYAPSTESQDLFEPITPDNMDFDDDPRAILQHQYREPTNSSIDVFEKMEDLNLKFDSGTFDFSTDLNVDNVDTNLRLPKDPSAAPSELPTIPETPKKAFKRRRWGSGNLPIFPGGVREAYIKALAVAAARHRMPQESWMFGQNISRAFVFSYFDDVPHVCPDCEKPVLPGEEDEETTPFKSPRKAPLKIKKEMKHIFKDVEVDDYYPGGKRNPLPRINWHGHRKNKKK